MNTQEILNTEGITKTEKIRRLLELGLTRRQVADLTGGNYGFVQNVFAKYFANQVNSRQQQTALAFIPFNRKFGVEIEGYGISMNVLAEALRAEGISCNVEGYNHDTRASWKLVSDSSLDGQNTFELVSPILQGQAGIEELEKVCTVLERKRVKINKSCGMHIHFDAESIGLEQMKNLLVNYSSYEAIIDSFMPQSRRGNTNCYCGSLNGYENKIEAAQSIRALADIFPTRYFKVNMKAYSRHKSVEFRQHSGTVEFTKISNWIVFLHNLLQISASKKFSRTEATFESLKNFNQTEILDYIVTRQNQLAA